MTRGTILARRPLREACAGRWAILVRTDLYSTACGANVCIFRPTALELPIVQADHYEYVWDAAGVLTIVKLTMIDRR